MIRSLFRYAKTILLQEKERLLIYTLIRETQIVKEY